MSPASAGALEVEKYIGSYLISSTARSKNNSKNSPPKHLNGFNRDNQHITSHHHNHQQNVFNSNILLTEFPQRYGSPIGNGTASEGWAGGVPLISMANHPRRNCGSKKNHNPLIRSDEYRNQPNQFARLAIHTHGAPLILTGRYTNNNNRGAKPNGANYQKHVPVSGQHNRSPNNDTDIKNVPNQNSSSSKEHPNDQPKENNTDCMSVASDESSGSNNSENCLPRIIKPRKRRKKDRKPNNVHNNCNNPTEVNDCSENKRTDNSNSLITPQRNNSDNNSNIVTLKPYVPFCYERFENKHINNNQRNRYSNINYFNNKVNCDQINAPINDFSRFKISESPINNNIEISDTPNLNHNFEDIKVCDEISANSYPVQQCGTVSCQCKYCDPSGLNIWDVEPNNGFSSFLPQLESFFASSNSSMPNLMTTSSCDIFSPARCHKNEYAMNENIVDKVASALRRSWSDPVSSFSPCITSDYSSASSDEMSSCKAGVIGAGRQEREWRSVPADSNFSTCSSSISSSISSSNFETSSLLNSSSQVLDISTEIVTSLNGHRDLEIKFFSSAASSPVEEKTFSATGFEARVLFSVDSSSGFGDEILSDNLVKSDISGDGGDLMWDNFEKDCDITYDTTDISRLLFEAEE